MHAVPVYAVVPQLARLFQREVAGEVVLQGLAAHRCGALPVGTGHQEPEHLAAGHGDGINTGFPRDGDDGRAQSPILFDEGAKVGRKGRHYGGDSSPVSLLQIASVDVTAVEIALHLDHLLVRRPGGRAERDVEPVLRYRVLREGWQWDVLPVVPQPVEGRDSGQDAAQQSIGEVTATDPFLYQEHVVRDEEGERVQPGSRVLLQDPLAGAVSEGHLYVPRDDGGQHAGVQCTELASGLEIRGAGQTSGVELDGKVEEPLQSVE